MSGGANSPEIARRRKFFRRLASDTVALSDEMAGVTQCRLSELPQLADIDLGTLVPLILPGTMIDVQNGQVVARLHDTDEWKILFTPEKANTEIFNRFDGQTSLAGVTQELAVSLHEEPAATLARVRTLFLHLVALGICVPANPPGENR